jgi:hypothetical protein
MGSMARWGGCPGLARLPPPEGSIAPPMAGHRPGGESAMPPGAQRSGIALRQAAACPGGHCGDSRRG